MTRFRRVIVSLCSAGVLATGLIAASPSSAAAYGAASWQLTAAGTFVKPGVGSFGFWGWCDLAGAFNPSNPVAGTSGDCEVDNYFYPPGRPAAFDCHQSIDITSWGEAPGIGTAFRVPLDLWLLAGTQTATGPDPAGCGGTGPTQPQDLAPAKAGHYNGNAFVGLLLPGAVGEIQITVAEVTAPF
jgi:hypothetical protein